MKNRDEIWKNWVSLEADMATAKAKGLNIFSSPVYEIMNGGFKSSITIHDSNKNSSFINEQPAGKIVSSNKNNP
ncbi:MAG: hypothetical protein EHM38_01585 [Geobacteraceae bacterium]|nr:MAG: hypothetical protein EHM38_01585 [Geobacteraceae bacterium]